MTNTEAETITVEVQPEAAITIINETEWNHGNLNRLRALVAAVQYGHSISWEEEVDDGE